MNGTGLWPRDRSFGTPSDAPESRRGLPLSLVHACHRHYQASSRSERNPDRIAGCMCRSPSPATAAFPVFQAGRLLHCPFRGLLGVLWTVPRYALHEPHPFVEPRPSFVTSTTVPIATGWSDSCRVGISRTERTRLSRRTEIWGWRCGPAGWRCYAEGRVTFSIGSFPALPSPASAACERSTRIEAMAVAST